MPIPRSAVHRNHKIYTMTMTAAMTAVICVLAPMALPVGPVPITLVNLAMYLALYLLGGKLGSLSCLLYVLIGLAGMPVFAGFTGGPGKLLGPTGGYIVGYVVMAVVSGLFIDRCRSRVLHYLGMTLGTALCYVLGTLWYCVSMDSGVEAALALCVIPFIPGDLVKMALAVSVGPMLRSRLKKTGLLK